MSKLSLDVVKTRKIILGLIVGVVLATTVFYIMISRQTTSPPDDPASTSEETSPNLLRPTREWLKERRSSPFKCWTIVDSGVYDITEFISSHADRDTFLAICGVDGTEIFKQQELYDQVQEGNLPDGVTQEGKLADPRLNSNDFL